MMDTMAMDERSTPASTPQVIEGEAHPIVNTAQVDTSDALHLFTCLLVGGGIEGTELLLKHARAWQARFAASPKLLPMPEEPSAADLVRYALVGLIFDSEDQVRRYASWWGAQLLRSAGVVTEVARPVTESWLMAPFQRPLRSLSLRMQSDLAHLIRRGRMEEAVSRVMATEITDEMVSVILDYLADKPEVRRLIQEQGTSLAGEVANEVQNQSASADDYVENLVRRLFNMAPRKPDPPPVSGT